MWERRTTRAAVANRVCTTERSSANGREIARVAACASGLSVTAVTAIVGVPSPTAANASSTSVVVPDREIASTASYARPAGISEAGNASVSPWPPASRAAAYAWAT